MAPKRKAAPQGAEASSSGPQVPARALRKQTSDQEAAKALYDNFRTWSEEDLYVRTESGQTVFQAVKAAQKQKKKDPKFKMGQKFYDALRVRFRPHESAEAKLKLPDDCQLPVDQQLLAATAAFRKRRPDRQGLFIFVAACRKLNKAELVGVCRLALRLNVKDPKQLSGAVKILECFHRVQIRAEFPEQFTIMEGWIDGVLKALEKGSKFEDPEAFLAEYGDVCSLLIQPSDLQEVKDAAGDYKNCSAALGRIVVGSKVGAKLYGFAVLKILAEEVATHIERSFEDWKGELDRAFIANHKLKLLQELDELPNISLLPQKREILAKYGSVNLKKNISGLSSEVDLRTEAKWRAVAVYRKQLPSLWCEAIVAPKGAVDSDPPFTLKPDVFRSAAVARARCNRIFEASEQSSGDIIRQTLNANLADWMLLDDGFGVEQCIMDMLSGADSDGALLLQVDKAMPTGAGDPVTLASVLQAANGAMPGVADLRVMMRRDDDAVVQRMLHQHFEGALVEQANTARVQGETLIEALRAGLDRSRSQTDPPIRLGHAFYQELKQRFSRG